LTSFMTFTVRQENCLSAHESLSLHERRPCGWVDRWWNLEPGDSAPPKLCYFAS